jgi:hypothetical protein
LGALHLVLVARSSLQPTPNSLNVEAD